MARAKTTTKDNTSQNEPEQEPLTGSGDIEAQDELEAIEAEVMEPEQGGADDSDTSAGGVPGDFLGADACSGLCTMIFDVLATRRGEHWRLAQPEAEQLGGALDQVLAKYLPDNMEKWGPEITLVTVASMIVLPRLRGSDAEA